MICKRPNGKIDIDGIFETAKSVTFVTNIRGKLYATRAKDVNNNIVVEKCDVDICTPYTEENQKLSPKHISLIKARIMTIITMIVMLAIAMAITHVCNNLMFFAIVIALGLDATIFKWTIVEYVKDFWLHFGNKELKRMHSASHKVFHAYVELGVVPSWDIAKEYSQHIEYYRYVKKSMGVTTLIVFFLLGWIRADFLTSEKALLIYIVALIGYAIIYGFDIYQFFDWYMYKNPTKYQISMAVCALSEHVDFINSLLENEEKARSQIDGRISMTQEQATNI